MKSILEQTYSKLEILCVDDGSTDESGKICDDYAGLDSRVKVFHCENGGVSKARNIGIRKASYEIIAFVDSDDAIENNMYESMFSFMQEQELECVCCNCSIVNPKGQRTNLKTPFEEGKILQKEEIMENIIEPMLGFSKKSTNGLCSVWNKLFRKSVIIENDIWFNENRSHGEDWQFCLEYFGYIDSVGFLQDEFYCYFHHTTDSLVTKYREDYFSRAVLDRKFFSKLFPMCPWESELKEKELWSLPVKSTIYYRQYLKGKELEQKLIEIYEICKMDYPVHIKYNLGKAEKSLQKALINDDKKAFIKELKSLTTITFLVNRMKKMVKQSIRI